MAGLKNFPFHFILLLLFFLLHGYSEYVGLIPFTDLLIFFLAAAAISFVLFFIFGRGIKAGLTTTLILLFYLFFGAVKDALHARYIILLPLMLLVVAFAIIYLKRTRRTFFTLTLFINLLLIIYLVVDIAAIAFKKPNPVTALQSFAPCNTCFRPDIYLIILDEYTGSDQLQSYFHFNNQPFANALRQRGFYVAAHPSSNYSATAVSVASLFSMNYLPAFHRPITAGDYTLAEKAIDQSAVMQFLEQSGYQFLNHSILNLRRQPGRFTTDLMPMRLKLITAKTLWNSIGSDLAWQIHGNAPGRFHWLAKFFPDDYKDGNQRLLKLTKEASAKKASQPRFIYAHLLMPHWPYLLDSAGRQTGISFYTQGLPGAKKESSYIQYLAYTNNQMLQLADTIISRTNGQAAIILMSDHGYRERQVKHCEALNNNFLSVYLPRKDYRKFYDSMSNVNVFRAMFNTLFHQQFERLPDQCIF